jgi:hypothetical protein
MFLSLLFCFADVVYYSGNSKIINCEVIKEDKEDIYIKTFVDGGIGHMKLPKNIIEAVDYVPFDSTKNSEIIGKTDEDYLRIPEIINEKIRKQKELEREIKAQQLKALEKHREEQRKNTEQIQAIVKSYKEQSISEDSVLYFIEPNIPLLATGTALTTLGIVNVIATFNLNNTISEAENYINENPELSEFFEEIYLNPLKRSRRQAIIFASVFSVAGVLDIYFSFERVSIDISGNKLNLSYNF